MSRSRVPEMGELIYVPFRVVGINYRERMNPTVTIRCEDKGIHAGDNRDNMGYPGVPYAFYYVQVD